MAVVVAIARAKLGGESLLVVLGLRDIAEPVERLYAGVEPGVVCEISGVGLVGEKAFAVVAVVAEIRIVGEGRIGPAGFPVGSGREVRRKSTRTIRADS